MKLEQNEQRKEEEKAEKEEEEKEKKEEKEEKDEEEEEEKEKGYIGRDKSVTGVFISPPSTPPSHCSDGRGALSQWN